MCIHIARGGTLVNQDERDLHVCPVARIDAALKDMNALGLLRFLDNSGSRFRGLISEY